MYQSFHGRSFGSVSLTASKAKYRTGFGPMLPGVLHTFFGDFDYIEQVLFTRIVSPGEVAAIVVEPILGEGGYVLPPEGWLRYLRDLCTEHGILLVADEVQTGFGRTGKMFAVEHHGVRPDVVVLAKGLGSGFPISAIGASAELMARWPRGSHGGTYGGNPIGCAAALATLDVITEAGFLDAVAARGRRLAAGLAEAAADDPGVAEVRSLGLMVAVEFRQPETGIPDTARVSAILGHCLTEGHLVLMSAGTYSQVIRFMPPLVVSEAEIDEALRVFEKALEATR
jgi:4-aminobutyrate aminotransferase